MFFILYFVDKFSRFWLQSRFAIDNSLKNLWYETIFGLHYTVYKSFFPAVFIFVCRCLVTCKSSVTVTPRCRRPFCTCGFAYLLRYFTYTDALIFSVCMHLLLKLIVIKITGFILILNYNSPLRPRIWICQLIH